MAEAPRTEQFIIKRRWFTSLPQIEVTIACEIDALPGVKLGLALKAAFKSGADLRGADLSDADLSGAVLSGADLSGAVLSGADLRGAVLSGADLSVAVLSGADLSDADLSGADLRGADLRGAVLRGAPKIENIHQAVYAAASEDGALDMSTWHHPCGTTHCRAGWVTTLAGPEGKALEDRVGTSAAATLIYLASDPELDRIPKFYGDNASAMADMKRLAEAEAAKAVL
jgi:uncharacterized protein YjbI with pentapeptide repeats